MHMENKMIYEIKRYTDDDGRQINEKSSLLSSANPLQTIEHSGTIGIRTPNGVMPISFEFPDELSLEECFEKFDQYAQEMIKQMQDASRILPSAQMPNHPTGNIILP